MTTIEAAQPQSIPTGRTRIVRYIVWSLDVWGHSSADCPEHGCPCMVENDSDDVDESEPTLPEREHDDNACDCHYNVNDRCRVGTLDVVETETEHNAGSPYAFKSWATSDDAIRDALVTDGYVKAEMRERIGFDDVGDESDIYVQDEKDGRPEFQLERDDVVEEGA